MRDALDMIKLHMEEDRHSHNRMHGLISAMDAKVDKCIVDIATLRAEFKISARLAMAVVGFGSGIAGAIIVAVLT